MKTILLLFIASCVMTASSSSSSSSSSGTSSGTGSSSSSSGSASSGSGAAAAKFKAKYIKIADVLTAINSVRKEPAKWATKIDTIYIKNMDKDKVTHTKWKRKFKEGLPAMQEAVKYLKNAKPKGELSLSYGMSYAAFKHSVYLLTKKTLTHTGKGGSSMSNRLEEYGDW